MKITVKQNFIDKVVAAINPAAGLGRMKARVQMSVATARFGETGFDTAGSPKRFMRGINTSSNSPDADFLDKQESIVGVCRDAAMNTPLAVAALSRKLTNTVGSGLRLQSQPDDTYLGISKEAARAWARNTQREFNFWAESKDCDITRTQNFYELQELAFFSILLSGDVCVLYPFEKRANEKIGTKIKLIESDLLSNPETNFDLAGKMLNGTIAGGIELDNHGAPYKYYFSDRYPGENFGMLENPKWTAIKAFDEEGKRQVHHLFFRKRPGQRRGIPLLAPMINNLKKTTKLADAELTAHVVSSFFTVFIKDMSGFNNGLAEGFAPTNSVLDPEKKPDDAKQYEMGAGSVLELDDDKEIQIADARRMSEGFEEFYVSFVRELSAGLNIAYEQLMMHFSASYSASRGALLEGLKEVRKDRAWHAINFAQPTFQHWLDEAVASGLVIAPGYLEDPYIRLAWSKASWSGMGNGQLDPKKETEAALLRINGNLSNQEKEYNAVQDDGDWEGAMHTKASNMEVLNNLDLLPVVPEETNDNSNDNDEDDTDTNDDKDNNES